MWCGHCQADVAAEVSSDNQRIRCANCGQEITPAEKLRTTVKTREARELLERWSNQKMLDPYGPVAGPMINKEPQASDSDASNAPAGESPQLTNLSAAVTSQAANMQVDDGETKQKGEVESATDDETVFENLSDEDSTEDNDIEPAVAGVNEIIPFADDDDQAEPMATAGLRSDETTPQEDDNQQATIGSKGPHFNLAKKRREERRERRKKRVKPHFRVDSAHPVGKSSQTQPAEQPNRQQPVAEQQPIQQTQAASLQSTQPPAAVQQPTMQQPAFANQAPPQQPPAPQQQMRWDDAHHPVLSAPHFDVQAAKIRHQKRSFNWTSFFGQLLAYGGVAMLTTGTVLILWGYFGGPTNYTPTGWLIATAGQMLLFLGVVTLVSGGMEQTTEEVSRRIDSLGDKLIRIEQASRDHALRGPKIPAQHYVNGPQQPVHEDQQQYVG